MTRTALWLIAVFALIAAACVAFGAYFSSVTLLNAHRHTVEARFAYTAERLVAVVERAAALGIALPAQTTVASLLEQEARIEPALLSIDLVDEHGTVIFSSDSHRLGRAEGATPAYAVSRVARNDFDVPIGRVVMRYDPRVLDAGAEALRVDLWRIGWPVLLAAAGATAAVGLLLALALRRAARRAATPHLWPPAARAVLAEIDAAHASLESVVLEGSPPQPGTAGPGRGPAGGAPA